MRATIDPRFPLPYYTMVLEGLSDLGIAVRFGRLDRPDGDGLAFEIEGRNVWVDTSDRARVELGPYEWADVHGKVNCTDQDVIAYPKVILLGPVFGTQIWRLPAGYSALPRLMSRGARARSTLAGLRFQGITRLPISAYEPTPSEPGYVFHRSRAWSGPHASTNGPRERFIDALESVGLAGDASLADDRISLASYLEQTRRSSVVFNCPAVHGCLGWKLGEYLALGKAIISIPLERALPEPLEHGEHIHYVDDNTEAMSEAVRTIDRDADYRHHLESGARSWYERNLTPAKIAARLVDEPLL
jgi:glycosyltransferase involved in cell wall biosynthesis